MTPEDFAFIAELVRTRSGIVIDSDKSYLVKSRLTPLANRYGHTDLEAFLRTLHHDCDDNVLTTVVESMATHETYFFRDKAALEMLATQIIPELRERRDGIVRVWCTAAATGQEPASLAMALCEDDPLPPARILATDLSRMAVAKAEAGLYTQFEVQRGLPVRHLLRHFEKAEDLWRLAAPVRAIIDHDICNLMDDFCARGPFDIILCRNVLIYFDAATRQDVLARLAEVLATDGLLVLGPTEIAFCDGTAFAPCDEHRTVFRRGRPIRGLPSRTVTATRRAV